MKNKKINIKFKKLSKAISIIASILKVCAIIGVIAMLIAAILLPYVLKKSKIDDNSITYNNIKIVQFNSEETKFLEKNTEILSLITKITNDENVYNIITLYFIIESIKLILLVFVFHYLKKLFKEFFENDTPFKIKNANWINKLAYSLLLYICVPVILSGIVELFIDYNLNFNWTIIEVLLLLVIFAFRYIIEYGNKLENNK